MASKSTLGAATQDRKARLAQLKSLKRKQPEPSNDEDTADTTADAEDNDVTTRYLSGRNYDPETRGPKLGFESAPNASLETLEQRARDLEASTKALAVADEETKDAPIDLFKLQPKKPNWDLKRDLKERMEVLDVRTNNAIARLVRERLEGMKEKDGEAIGMEGSEFVEAVHARERMEEEEGRRERETDEEEVT